MEQKIIDSKKRWAARHVQIKITVLPEIAEKFKKLCLVEGVSMTGKLISFMTNNQIEKAPINQYNTRAKRRKALSLIIRECEAILDAEQGYLDRMPVNLESSPMHDVAEDTVSDLEEALDCLRRAF